jgi:uncharacterized membrane protein
VSNSSWFKSDVGTALAERTALMAAIASTGRTFGRGLMPRTLVGQSLATGLTGSVNYGLIVTSQSALWAGASVVAQRFLPDEPPEGAPGFTAYRNQVRAAAYGTFAVSALAARPLQQLVEQRPGESVTRGVARGYLERLELISGIGLVTAGVLDAALTLAGAENMSQSRRRLLGTGLTLLTGTALATYQVHRDRQRLAIATGEPAPPLEPRSIVAGAGTALGLTALGRAESVTARGLASAVPDPVPRALASAVGHGVCLGVLGVGIWQGVERLYGNVEQAGAVVESFHQEAPVDAHVSGGPASSLEWSTLSREGRRFAALPLTTTEINDVMRSTVAPPVRVFVPLAAAETAEERAALAVAEMEALGAFDRSLVVVCSPTGTGYINYVMAETVEYLTRGDSAIVTVQYSLRPSFLSLDRVKVGRANVVALLAAIDQRLQQLPEERRPRLVLFGESLGAHTSQDASLHEGVAGFTRRGIDRALFIGTPDESGWARQWRADPAGADPNGVVVEVDSYEAFEALPEEQQQAARIFLISHDEDPITKFGPDLILERPPWLDPDRSKRPAGIPPEMEWRPLSTFFVTVADVLNSMTVVPGQFGADGHDYRSDLARFVMTAFDLPCTPEELARIEAALRRRELAIAESRLVADKVASTRAAAEAQLARWGVEGERADGLIASEVARSRSFTPSSSRG